MRHYTLLMIGTVLLAGCEERTHDHQLEALKEENVKLRSELKSADKRKLPPALEMIYQMEWEEYLRDSAESSRESARFAAGMNFASEASKERARLDMKSAEEKAAGHQKKISAMKEEFVKAGPSEFETEQLKRYDERAGLRASIAFLNAEMGNTDPSNVAEYHAAREEKSKRLDELSQDWKQVLQEGWKEHY